MPQRTSLDGPEDELLTEVDGRGSGSAALSRHPGFRALLEASTAVMVGISLHSRLDRDLVDRLRRELARRGRIAAALARRQ